MHKQHDVVKVMRMFMHQIYEHESGIYSKSVQCKYIMSALYIFLQLGLQHKNHLMCFLMAVLHYIINKVRNFFFFDKYCMYWKTLVSFFFFFFTKVWLVLYKHCEITQKFKQEKLLYGNFVRIPSYSPISQQTG